ncbi:hypothetical protein K523DRAFT_354515 [Schizophyllum commune Tattone D]|nr:hypothetical protein K523DRAFT_354515 [Schizophyllum commune Tattone D]
MCARWACWGVYWWFQGLIFTGIWVIGHECGNGAFSDYKLLNDAVGFVTPMERDEVYVPKTRADLGLPPADEARPVEYDEIMGDTPLYTLFMLSSSYQAKRPTLRGRIISIRNAVLLSNAGVGAMIIAVISASHVYSLAAVMKYYDIPRLLLTHWFIMITYLHHTTPELPHYRGREWNFQRGAAATVDRPFLGWQGRFFLHDVAHFHVVHHFFSKMPFYHGEEATKYLQAFIGEHYAYSGKPIFKALWENYNRCQFVEDEGSVLFYRDRQGRATRRAVRV